MEDSLTCFSQFLREVEDGFVHAPTLQLAHKLLPPREGKLWRLPGRRIELQAALMHE